MDAVIISCGTELVTGQCVDTNSAWLSARLTAIGVNVASHVCVGDALPSLVKTLDDSRLTADLVVVTGGLGPTRDDLTREALAESIKQPLQENAEALNQITTFFHRWQRPMPESNKVQALIPAGCEVIPNPRGTAPGIAWWPGGATLPTANAELRGGAAVIALPGVPREMKAMFESSVAPRLGQLIGDCVLAARLHCFGISEARVGEAIADLMERTRNPLVGTTASQAVITIRILSRGATAARAQDLLCQDLTEVRRRLGAAVFGENEETIQSSVGQLLSRRQETVATAESCTGGLLAKMLTDVPGSSAYFLGGFVCYSNQMKSDMLGIPHRIIETHGAVSEEVARSLSQQALERVNANYALGITGIAGPGGGSADKPVGLVYIGLACNHGVEVRRVLLGEHLSRDEIRDRACKTALNMLRLRMMKVQTSG